MTADDVTLATRIAPHSTAAWVSTETMLDALSSEVDPAWARDLKELRGSVDMIDPFPS